MFGEYNGKKNFVTFDSNENLLILNGTILIISNILLKFIAISKIFRATFKYYFKKSFMILRFLNSFSDSKYIVIAS